MGILLSRIRLGACRKLCFYHCSGRPSLSSQQLLSLLELSTELLTWKRETRSQGGSPGHLICCGALTWKSVEKAAIPVKTLLCSSQNTALFQPPGSGMSCRDDPSLLLVEQESPGLWPLPPSSKVGWEIPVPAPFPWENIRRNFQAGGNSIDIGGMCLCCFPNRARQNSQDS